VDRPGTGTGGDVTAVGLHSTQIAGITTRWLEYSVPSVFESLRPSRLQNPIVVM
jgi:hypothetical protein